MTEEGIQAHKSSQKIPVSDSKEVTGLSLVEFSQFPALWTFISIKLFLQKWRWKAAAWDLIKACGYQMGLNTHLCKFGCNDLRILFLSLRDKHSQEHGINHGKRLGKIVVPRITQNRGRSCYCWWYLFQTGVQFPGTRLSSWLHILT